ncbi:LysE family translocator [Herbiconiux sp. SYSU D00978]|uniref:LysE family translocator n=1 Tax=Herbiconiux sp. SYSU D00978 TaxID=2812562 RepID=UPI001A978DEA|nr:LysE family translocator [Herbiconiux sp. SYSU D00978]
MPPLDSLLAFTLASLVIIVVPGPSVLFVIGRSISLGRTGGVLSVLGNAAGMLPLAALVAVGVGALVASSEVALTVIRLVGAAYLVWLGIRAIRHRDDAVRGDVEPPPRTSSRLLAEGFVVGVTNPKTIAFFVAVLPQFVDPAAAAPAAQMLVLGAVFVVLACACDTVWALAAGTAREWFSGSPRRLAHLAVAGGVMMILLGVVLALSGGKG